MINSHSEKEIYEGCKRLMGMIVKEFEAWCEWLGVECDKDEMFSISMPNSQIIRELFLSRTNHSGMTSTIEKCKELGLDFGQIIRFSIDIEEEKPSE